MGIAGSSEAGTPARGRGVSVAAQASRLSGRGNHPAPIAPLNSLNEYGDLPLQRGRAGYLRLIVAAQFRELLRLHLNLHLQALRD